jgi:hypothetical protein
MTASTVVHSAVLATTSPATPPGSERNQPCQSVVPPRNVGLWDERIFQQNGGGVGGGWRSGRLPHGVLERQVHDAMSRRVVVVALLTPIHRRRRTAAAGSTNELLNLGLCFFRSGKNVRARQHRRFGFEKSKDRLWRTDPLS